MSGDNFDEMARKAAEAAERTQRNMDRSAAATISKCLDQSPLVRIQRALETVARLQKCLEISGLTAIQQQVEAAAKIRAALENSVAFQAAERFAPPSTTRPQHRPSPNWSQALPRHRRLRNILKSRLPSGIGSKSGTHSRTTRCASCHQLLPASRSVALRQGFASPPRRSWSTSPSPRLSRRSRCHPFTGWLPLWASS